MSRTLDTSMGGDRREFPPTPGVIGEAGASWAAVLEGLSKTYWKPVYLYIRMVWGRSNEDAKDLAQQFFLHLMKNQAVERYRPSRAPFRTYLKACLKNFLTDEQRRRAGRAEVPLDGVEAAAEAPDAEAEFERAWVRSVVEAALGDVRSGLDAEGRRAAWAVFEAYDLRDPSARKATYAELGAPHGMSEADVRNALALVRARLRDAVVEQVRRSVNDPAELANELAHLGFL